MHPCFVPVLTLNGSPTKQGCILSPFLFPLVTDWVTKQSIDSKETDIQWISGRSFEVLEYADDLAVLFQPHTLKTRRLEDVAASVGLRINKKKQDQIMKVDNQPTDIYVDKLLD